MYRRQVTSSLRSVETVLPNARDRRIPALRSFLGHAPLFYRSESSERRPRPLRVPIVHLYLDVSGSMTECLPYLSAACREPFKRGELKIFAFSTVVSELKGHDLSKAPMQNTWGTDINASSAHHWHPYQAPAESHINRHRWICGARSQRPDCQTQSHASSRCPNSFRACRRPPTVGPRNDQTTQTMKQHAEYVSPGHPDRLADAIAESIVTAAVRQKPDALVGVEVAVHTDCVFVDGRIAGGSQAVDIEKIVRNVYRAAGYGGSWNPDPEKIRVTTDLCQEALSPEESDIRPFSDDQNIVIGYACGDERTNYLPAAHWISGELGRRLFARLRSDADLSRVFGPDFKILVSLEMTPGETQVEWRRLVLSIQHLPKLSYERQHRIVLPMLKQILRDLEAGGLDGVASTFTNDKLILNGAGEFAIGGPEGDNGLSGKSSLSTITDRASRSAEERLRARIRTRWTNAGPCGHDSWQRHSFAEESMKPV